MKNDQLIYQGHFVPYTRDELVGKLRAALSDHRFQHCLRVEQTAMDLAEQNGVDVEKAAIAPSNSRLPDPTYRLTRAAQVHHL